MLPQGILLKTHESYMLSFMQWFCTFKCMYVIVNMLNSGF